jgi:hypothetical protein
MNFLLSHILEMAQTPFQLFASLLQQFGDGDDFDELQGWSHELDEVAFRPEDIASISRICAEGDRLFTILRVHLLRALLRNRSGNRTTAYDRGLLSMPQDIIKLLM